MRSSASRFAFISGMPIQPSTAPTHQGRGERPSASRKFSVLIESRSVPQITRARRLGAGRSTASADPASIAAPDTLPTNP